MCEELRKRKVDVCCLQEVRWRGEGARFFSVKGRRYKLWWCGNDKIGGVGVLSYPWGIATHASSGGCGGAEIEEVSED